MKVNGTLINYYFHCKRQCWLHGNRVNLEDNSEDVKIGKAIHELKQEQNKETEISIENIKIDKLSAEYLTEIKKSDADVNAATWQLLLYLKILKDKGIDRKGKLEFIEKNKSKNIIYVELDDEKIAELDQVVREIEVLLQQATVPVVSKMPKCKKCAYYEYCFI
ncbi:CRISPR-associated protein Cas4 [Clostridium aminobutyricum]|uniref:CRISPR-associated protein Cas4 n=1 Tax=Clostridium aminobutyricum TaxID=33953 RepID=A0A939IGG5_CLOAM|nr:CRISPR-associated protein Cas4 [Clostridium aminobutyricum]MBN7771882.1 CRISPR-associated protein Cas4 [Clostridium aminobutyricum]